MGRAELVPARALAALGAVAETRSAADRAIVALSNGYGASNPRTRDACSFRASLSN